jgi:hypothetical protein
MESIATGELATSRSLEESALIYAYSELHQCWGQFKGIFLRGPRFLCRFLAYFISTIPSNTES